MTQVNFISFLVEATPSTRVQLLSLRREEVIRMYGSKASQFKAFADVPCSCWARILWWRRSSRASGGDPTRRSPFAIRAPREVARILAKSAVRHESEKLVILWKLFIKVNYWKFSLELLSLTWAVPLNC